MAFRRVAVATVVCATLSATHTSLLAKFIPGGLGIWMQGHPFTRHRKGMSASLTNCPCTLKKKYNKILKKNLGELNCKKCLLLCINYSQGTVGYNTTQWLSADRKACSLKFFDVSFFFFFQSCTTSVCSVHGWVGTVWGRSGRAREHCVTRAVQFTLKYSETASNSAVSSHWMQCGLWGLFFFPCHCTRIHGILAHTLLSKSVQRSKMNVSLVVSFYLLCSQTE